MDNVVIGCSGITWGSFRQKDPDAWPQTRVLEEIARAGYDGTGAGPWAGAKPVDVIDLYARYGLKPGPGYISGDYWNPDARPGILQIARQQAEFAAALGVTELFAGPSGSDYMTRRGKRRWDIAAQVRPDDALTDDEFERMAACLNEVGRITLEYGVSICVHNHVGQVIETREEIDRLFALVDHELVFHGTDIGHLAWAGGNVVQYCRDYAGAIKCLHLKDIDPMVREHGIREGWTYGEFADHGIFAELGEGFVDFSGMLDVLDEAGYTGWVIVETDRTQKATPLESATISREYLKSIGL
jgi:inosose dehydratase